MKGAPVPLAPRPILAAVLAVLAAAVPAAAVELPEAQHPETRHLIDLVERAAQLFEREGHRACQAFKEPGSEWFHDDVYVFVIDFGGIAHCHPAQPELEGQDLFGLHDADGRPIMELMVRQLKDGGSRGWVHYLWPRPSDSVQTWKSTYLRRVTCPEHDVDLIVASGAYNLPMEKLFVVDRVEEAARLIAREGGKAFTTLRSKAGGFIFLDAYVFVMSFEGKMLVHPFAPELEGTDVLDVHDREGIYPGREMLSLLAARDSGWVEYFWPRPGGSEPIFKETFVRKVEMDGRTLVLGSGVYFE